MYSNNYDAGKLVVNSLKWTPFSFILHTYANQEGNAERPASQTTHYHHFQLTDLAQCKQMKTDNTLLLSNGKQALFQFYIFTLSTIFRPTWYLDPSISLWDYSDQLPDETILLSTFNTGIPQHTHSENRLIESTTYCN